jgi:hypothetical protein
MFVIISSTTSWPVLRRKSLSLSALDNAFALSSDISAFFNLEILSHANVLSIMTIFYWQVARTAVKQSSILMLIRLMSIISVVTPATLSVHLVSTTNSTQMQVPILNWESWDWMTIEGAGFLQGPSVGLTRNALAASSSISVLAQTAPFPNSSYPTEFFGPS